MTDEELVRLVESVILNWRHCLGTDHDKVTDEELVRLLAERVVFQLQSHLSARHQKELKEATDESSDYRRQVNEGDW